MKAAFTLLRLGVPRTAGHGLLAMSLLVALWLLAPPLGETQRLALLAGLGAAATALGALIGARLAGAAALLYPLGMGAAAGAMVAVVSHEIIPETHRKGHERAATLGIIGGFIAMMLLDTTLS